MRNLNMSKSVVNNGQNIDVHSVNSVDPIEHAKAVFDDSSEQGDFFSSILGQWLFPGVQQEREFAQQVAFQEMQNNWNSEQSKMERAKAAGINPVTAAQSITGASSPAVGGPNSTSSAGTIGEPLTAVNGMIGSIGDVFSKAVHAKKEIAETNEIAPSAEVQRLLMRAQTYKAFADKRFSTAQAIGIEIENQTRGESLILDLAAKRLNLPLIRSEILLNSGKFKQAMSEIDLNLQKIEESKATISLMEYQELLNAALARKANLESDNLAWENNIKQKFQFDPTWPTHSIIWSTLSNPNLTDEEAENNVDYMLETLYDIQLKQAAASGLVQMAVNANKALDEYYKESALQGEKSELDITKSWSERPSFSLGKPK